MRFRYSPLRPMRAADLVVRRIVLAAYLLVVQRYLDPLVPGVSLFLWFVGGTVLLDLLHRRAVGLIRTIGILVAALPGSALAVFFGALVFYRFRHPASGAAIEQVITVFPYAVTVPAIIAVVTVVLDAWFLFRPRVRSAFAPCAVVGAVLLFWSQGLFQTALFPHPIWYLFSGVALAVLVVLHQRLVADRQSSVRGGVRRLWFLIPLIAIVAGLTYSTWSTRSVEAGGGLLRPEAFHFDFSDYIQLESQIGLNRDLVLVYREDGMPRDRLIRRYVLSGYSRQRGFYRLSPEDEPSSPGPVSVSQGVEAFAGSGSGGDGATPPEAPPRTGTPPVAASAVEQEYHIVNLDRDALLAVNRPYAVGRLPVGADSSFQSAYRVLSQPPVDATEQLSRIGWPQELDPAWREAYLAGPIPAEIAELAREVTAEVSGYYETVSVLEAYFLENFHYSLNPGVATDGDQLTHFLFSSQKGYCSYFAFSMTLMARSLGIPARVALGFFTDPENGVLGFHPVRGDMAHAWVEVWFPGVGWVEFDPTSQNLAPGETVSTDYRIDQERLVALVEEILNREDSGDTEPADTGERPVEGAPTPGLPGVVIAALVVLFGVIGMILRRRWWCHLARRKPRRGAEYLLRRSLVLQRRTRRLGLQRAGSAPAVSPHTAISNAVAPDGGSFDRPSTGAIAAGRLPPPLDRVGREIDRSRYAAAYTSDELDHLHRLVRGLFSSPPHGPGGVFAPFQRALWWLWVYLPSRFPHPCGRPGHRSRGTALGALFLVTVLATLTFIPIAPARVVAQDGTGSGGADGAAIAPFGAPEPPQPGAAEESAGAAVAAEEAIRAIDTAIDAEAYSRALELIARGRREFPQDYRFPNRAAGLYYREGLFGSARDALEDALRLGTPAYPAQYQLSRTLARMNRDTEAITILEQLHRAEPEDRIVVDDLAWLYYKQNRLTAAAELLSEALATLGSDRDMSMTLATVYAGQLDYDRAVGEYQRAIDSATADQDRYFLAVAWYNKSILHARFYRWDEAQAAASHSMEMMERASAFMIRAELQERQLDLTAALSDLERAVTLEETGTLPKLSLAAARLNAGDPDRAIALVEDVMQREHEGWLYFYGTDPDRYLQQLYKTAADAWEAGAARDRVYRPGSLWDRLGRRVRSVWRRAKGWYYRGLFRRQSLRVANAFAAGDRQIRAAIHRMYAVEPRSRVAMTNLERARELELPLNPGAAEDYRLIRADLTGDVEIYRRLAAELTGRWQRGQRLEALLGVYDEFGTRSEEGLRAAAHAWVMQPGAFLVRGMRVPFRVENAAGGVSRTGNGAARRTLRRLGIAHAQDSPLRLTITWTERGADWGVRDVEQGVLVRRGTVTVGGTDRERDRLALEEIARELTSVR